MITAIQLATIYVSDQDKARAFYTEKLGFELRADNAFGPDYRWIQVAPPSAHTSLVLAKGYGDWSADRVGTFTGIVFDIDDIQQTYESLRDRGVEFTEPPTMQPWGMMQALFLDQDRNVFVLVQR